jgi:hypothetical protein
VSLTLSRLRVLMVGALKGTLLFLGVYFIWIILKLGGHRSISWTLSTTWYPRSILHGELFSTAQSLKFGMFYFSLSR